MKTNLKQQEMFNTIYDCIIKKLHTWTQLQVQKVKTGSGTASTNADRWFIWKGFCGRLIIQVIFKANTLIRSEFFFICWLFVHCITVDLVSQCAHNQMKRWPKVVMKNNIHFKSKRRHVKLIQNMISSLHSLHPPTPDYQSVIYKDRGSY